MEENKKISTKKAPITGKLIEPGNVIAKINNIIFEKAVFKKKDEKDPDSWNIIFHIEGPDLGKDFEGFFIDYGNPAKGRHRGLVGKVKADEWPFKDGITKGGTKIERDKLLLRFLHNTCEALGLNSWLDEEDNKHDSVDSLIQKFCTDGLYKDKWLRMCIMGKEYLNSKKFLNYDMAFPKFSKTNVPFELESVPASQSRVILFDPSTHIRKKKVESVESFGEEEIKEETPKTVNKDFEL